jgi:hypothetical protein
LEKVARLFGLLLQFSAKKTGQSTQTPNRQKIAQSGHPAEQAWQPVVSPSEVFVSNCGNPQLFNNGIVRKQKNAFIFLPFCVQWISIVLLKS